MEYWPVLFITEEQLGKSYSETSNFKYWGSTAAALVFNQDNSKNSLDSSS